MVADNNALTSLFTQRMASEVGVQYELLCIPEQAWIKLRENFIKDNGLDHKKPDTSELDLLNEPSFMEEVQRIEEQDPLVSEAEKRFGKTFIDV